MNDSALIKQKAKMEPLSQDHREEATKSLGTKEREGEAQRQNQGPGQQKQAAVDIGLNSFLCEIEIQVQN